MMPAERRIARFYLRRNRRLRSLGYRSYADYLASDLWRQIRDAVITLANGRCEICGKPARCVHHGNYSTATLTGRNVLGRKEKPAKLPLFALCHSCHKFIEFHQDGSKAKKQHVRKRMFYLRWLKSQRKCP